MSLGYHIQTRIGAAEFVTRGGGDFCPSAVLTGPIAKGEAPVTIGLTDASNLDLVRIGSAAMVDDEILRVDALDLVAMTATLARGCVDTGPAAHGSGARIWFFEKYAGRDAQQYSAGTTVQAKLPPTRPLAY